MSPRRPAEKPFYRKGRLIFVSIRFNKAGIISAFGQCGQQGFQMRTIAQLAFNIGNQTLGGQIGKDALVINFEHIGVEAREYPKHPKKCAGPVLQAQADARQTA